ncbi:MAG: hypothetical protein ACM3VV_05990 [Deltaproteobacteria bacterium]
MFSEVRPKNCTYGCGVEIYWNTEENTYFELYSRKKHICPNRGSYNNKKSIITPPIYAAKPRYYNNNNDKKSDSLFNNNQPQTTITNKLKMDNSFELLTGSSISNIQKQYEILSDIVRDHNGKVHGSQRDRDPKTGLMDLLVYYEVPLGKREEVKRKFDNFVRNHLILQ